MVILNVIPTLAMSTTVNILALHFAVSLLFDFSAAVDFSTG